VLPWRPQAGDAAQRQREVTEEVRAELQLAAFRGSLQLRHHHDARIVDKGVDRFVPVVDERSNRL
jgi:hypothetical protein